MFETMDTVELALSINEMGDDRDEAISELLSRVKSFDVQIDKESAEMIVLKMK